MPRKVLDTDKRLTILGGSFNEAGAVMPRKGLIEAKAPIAQLRFNEAGAVMPRKVLTATKAIPSLPLLQ